MVFLDPEVTGSSAIRPQVVSDQSIGNETVFLQQLAHELQRGMLVPFRLDQHIEDFALGIDGAPQVGHAALGRRLRKSAAISGPKWFIQRRMDS
jgi:hypothetical protein